MKTFKLSFSKTPVFEAVTGLLNKTWNGTAVSGRAATEDQLAAAIAALPPDEDHISVVEAASSGNISVSSSTSGDTTTYTLNTGSTITGLTNTTWVEGTNPVSGRAATEDQLQAAIDALPADVNTITTVAGAGGIDVTDAGTGGNHAYTVKPGSQMTVGSTEQGSTDNPILIDGEGGVLDGLTNTTWVSGTNPVSGRAATEDQLKAAIDALPADVNTITTVEAASGSSNVTVTDNGTGGNHAYVIAVDEAEEVEVVSIDSNIIVTEETV